MTSNNDARTLPCCVAGDCPRVISNIIRLSPVQGGEPCCDTPLQVPGELPGPEAYVPERAHRPYAPECVAEKEFARLLESGGLDPAFDDRDRRLRRFLEDQRAHDASYATAVEARGEEPRVVHQEHVAHGARNQCPGAREHQRLGDGGIVPFGAREHLLEPVAVLEAGKRCVLSELRRREAHLHAVARRGGFFRRPRVAKGDAARGLAAAHAVATCPCRATGYQDLDDRAGSGCGELAYLDGER